MRKSKLLQLALVLAATAAVAVGCSSSKTKEQIPEENPTAMAPGQGLSVGVAKLNISGKNVYDAGTYNEKMSVQDLKILGGKFFEAVPSEKFQSVDRDKNAPLGKLIYVYYDDESRCIPAKYSMLDNTKKLVVYSKSTVPQTYCIYQKTAMAEPMGFSLSVKDGGICHPSILISKIENDKTVSYVEMMDKIVSINYCLENTTNLGTGHKSEVAASEEKPAAQESATKPTKKKKQRKEKPLE